MTIRRTKKEKKQVLNLEGPEGNAYVLLGTCRRYAIELGMDWDTIEPEAKSGDYIHLVKTLQTYFGNWVDFATDYPEKYK